MRLHAGEISIRSRIGEGTRVSVRLPLDCEPVAPAKRHSPLPAGVTSYLPAHLPNSVAAYRTSPAKVDEEAASRIDIRVKKSA